MRHMLGNLSPNYFERTKRYMMLRASRQGTDLTVTGAPPLSLPNSVGKPLKAWSVDVLPYQEGTGDPSPDNIRPIHGTDKINLYGGSPNIWDEEWENGYYTSQGDPSSPSANYIRSKNYVEVTPSAQYYCATGTSYIFCLQFYDENKGFLSQDYTFRDSVVTIPSNCHYIRFWRNESEYHYNTAINYPATVTDYNPHQGGITSITLPQTVYTGTIGSEGGESRTRYEDIKANANSYYMLNGLGGKYCYRELSQDERCILTAPQLPLAKQQELFTHGSIDNPYQYVIDCAWVYSNTVRVSAFGFDNITDWKNYINEQSEIGITYPLETPQTFPLTAPTIPTPTGTATTWATAEDGTVESMEVTYVGKA